MTVQDTSPEAQRRYYELLAEKSPVERLQIALRLSSMVRELATADRLYGPDVATRLFPMEPSDAVAVRQ